jgi:hypothetical protein
MTLLASGTWFPSEGGWIAPSRPGDVDTSQKMPLGTIRKFKHPSYGEGEFIYLKGATSVAAYEPVTYSLQHVAVRTAASTGLNWAVSTAAVDAATKFGWFQISGMAISAKTKTVSMAAGILVGVSTAGLISISSSLKELSGAVTAIVASATTTTNNGHRVVLMLNRPRGQTRIT